MLRAGQMALEKSVPGVGVSGGLRCELWGTSLQRRARWGQPRRPPWLAGWSSRNRLGGRRGFRTRLGRQEQRGAFKRGRCGRGAGASGCHRGRRGGASAELVPDAPDPAPRGRCRAARRAAGPAGRADERAAARRRPERGPAMGFLHQLQLLLWKNVTLKRRSPVSDPARLPACPEPEVARTGAGGALSARTCVRAGRAQTPGGPRGRRARAPSPPDPARPCRLRPPGRGLGRAQPAARAR